MTETTTETPGIVALRFLLALAKNDSKAISEALGVVQDATQAAALISVLGDIIVGSLPDPVPTLQRWLYEARGANR